MADKLFRVIAQDFIPTLTADGTLGQEVRITIEIGDGTRRVVVIPEADYTVEKVRAALTAAATTTAKIAEL